MTYKHEKLNEEKQEGCSEWEEPEVIDKKGEGWRYTRLKKIEGVYSVLYTINRNTRTE